MNPARTPSILGEESIFLSAQLFHFGARLLCILLLAGCNSESSPTVEQPSSETVSAPGSTSLPPSPGGSSSSEQQATGDSAYIRSAEIFPNPITLERPVQVVIDALDPKGGPVTFQHQWRVNGSVLDGATSPQLAPGLLRRGDKVSVTVVPVSGQGPGLPFQTKEVPVHNTVPRVTSLTIKPFPVRLGDQLVPQVEVVDPDGDEVTLRYRWKLNGKVVLEGDPQPYDLTEGNRGDEVELEVIPQDATGSGEPFLSKKIRVSNSLPQITSTPPSVIHNNMYLYAVTAVDSDGDPLKFGLKDPPAKMTIHPTTGTLQWSLTPEVSGRHTITVTVNDGQHDEPVEQEFDITIGSELPEFDG